MTINKTFRSICLLLTVSLLVFSCKKKNSGTDAIVDFSILVNGDSVTFTNLTTGAVSYKWDFGDGTSSTDASPVHVYPGKGKYVPTLYATIAGGGVLNGSTVIHIAKTSPIRLNDNTLSDWDTISVNTYTSGSGGGSFIKAKFDYDANSVYFYFEMTATVADGNIFDFYLDDDDNPATGLTTGLFTSGGYDELLEGQLLLNQNTAPIPMTPYVHTGAQSAFSFSALSVTDYFVVGTIVQDGSVLKFEGSLDRSKLSLTGAAMRLGVTATKSDWSVTLGTLPDQDTDSYLLNLPD